MSPTPVAESSVAGIFNRLLSNGQKRLTPALARHFLSLSFAEADKTRMHDLAVRNQDGALSPEEKEELINFVEAGCLLGVLHSQARRVLRKNRKKTA